MDDEGQTVAGTSEVIEPALPEDGIDLADFADDAEFEVNDVVPRGFTGIPEMRTSCHASFSMMVGSAR
jgi:hypothetical protein